MIMYKAMEKLKVGDTIFCLRNEAVQETPFTLCRIPVEVAPALVLRPHGTPDAPPMDNIIDIAWKDTGCTQQIGAERCFLSDAAARSLICLHIDWVREWLGEERTKIILGGIAPVEKKKERSKSASTSRSHKKKASRVTRGL
jgi:hypothetical protein